MKRKWKALLCFMAVVLVISGISLIPGIRPMVGVIGNIGSDVLLLDPGHGGMDGGAVGVSGISEKDINLSISKYIKEMAEADGWRVVMSREKDEGLYKKEIEDGSQGEKRRSIRSMKSEDLKNRVALIAKVQPRLAVSVHLNSFKQDSSVHGAQTFYPGGDPESEVIAESKRLAEIIQAHLVQGIDDGSNRVALSKKGVMLFKAPEVPIVIVECGFLSNNKDEALLQNQDYQKQLARYIYEGILEYTGRKVQKSIPRVDSRG